METEICVFIARKTEGEVERKKRKTCVILDLIKITGLDSTHFTMGETWRRDKR